MAKKTREGRRRCPRCGKDATGKFCSHCGASLERGTDACGACGAGLETGALFCGECGAPVGKRPRKPAASYLPWILSAVALAVFAVAITIFVRNQAGPRAEGMPPTGGIITGESSGGGTAPATGMPTAAELAAMSPREAADRLFDRAMRTDESGDVERARFFADMSAQAYSGLPPDQLDLDARFHLGLLYLLMDDPAAASAEADVILGANPDHLLGLALVARVANRRGDAAARKAAYSRFLRALAQGLVSDVPEYRMHDRLLETEAEVARQVTGEG